MTQEQAKQVKKGDLLVVFVGGESKTATVNSVTTNGMAAPYFRFDGIGQVSWKLCSLPKK